jgi:hypothetical protein
MIAGAQVKTERETRVSRRNVPEQAREFINETFEGFKRVRWYFEESNEGNSYEAKFRWQRKQYSVKFDTTGKLVDIEWIIAFEEIPETAKENIMGYLNQNFTSFRILKIQKQLLGDEDDLEDFIDEDEYDDVTINYEFEIQGKTPDENKLWEILFSSEGEVLLRREINLPDNFNLDF